MSEVKEGDAVRVHYRGTLADGTEFDSSEGRDPIAFTVGDGTIIPGFDAAVRGMAAGEKRRFTIPADDAYGPRHDELVHVIDRGDVPPEMEIAVGMRFQISGPNQEGIAVTVTDLSDETVTLDANHPLAGEDLVFEIELIEIG